MIRERELRSSAFRREREAGWRELEALLAGLELGRRPARLSPEALLRLPVLYRNAVSSLSVARAISLDANLLAYLEHLATRAHLAIHARRPQRQAGIGAFLWVGFPRAVRELGVWLAAAVTLMALGGAVGYALTSHDPEYFFAFVHEALAGERTPWADVETLRATLYDPGGGMSLEAFALQLFAHNTGIGLLCVALGAIGGVLVVPILIINGAMLGAMWAVFGAAGLGVEFASWVLPHGITELLAIALCGAAGLTLGRAMLFPGRLARLEALALAGRNAGVVALGAVLLFAIAAAIEGLFRQQVDSLAIRYLVATATMLLWLGWLGLAGRRRQEPG